MSRVALEVPLRALTLGRCRQGHDAADPGIEALSNPLDHATLAGGVAAFKDDNDLEFLRHDPVLQLHQLPLQAEQFLEVEDPVEPVRLCLLGESLQRLRQPLVVELHFQLLIEAVGNLGVNLAGQITRFVAFGHFSVGGPAPHPQESWPIELEPHDR
jgi:hypothetical protein